MVSRGPTGDRRGAEPLSPGDPRSSRAWSSCLPVSACLAGLGALTTWDCVSLILLCAAPEVAFSLSLSSQCWFKPSCDGTIHLFFFSVVRWAPSFLASFFVSYRCPALLSSRGGRGVSGRRKAGGGGTPFGVLCHRLGTSRKPDAVRGRLVVARSNQIQIEIFSSPDTYMSRAGRARG